MDKRNFERKDCQLTMRIYSSLKAGAYSVDVANISFGGAYISSRHLPNTNETISFELIDSTSRPIYFSNASVVRVQNGNGSKKGGFAVKFDRPIGPALLEQAAQ